MRGKLFTYILALGLSFFFSETARATNPVFSNWIINVSEGAGEAPVGYDDTQPEIAISGNTVHVLWQNFTFEGGLTSLFYRRSVDGGKTWQGKIMLESTNAFDGDRTARRMFVSGNYVHVAAVKRDPGNNNFVLVYYRSTNGGASFEAPRTIHSVPNELRNLRISGDGSRVNLAVVWACHYCAVTQVVHFFHSGDNGATFADRVVPDDYTPRILSHWDVRTVGSRIYFYYLLPVGAWYNYDNELHFVSSQDDGNSFSEVLLSRPAQNGVHHTFFNMDSNWGYTAKIASDGNRVAIIWSGWNEMNQTTVFAAVSNNGGQSFGEPKALATGINALQHGLETIVINGDEIYACYVQTDSRVYVVKSADGGLSFSEAYEFTQPDNYHIRGMWQPVLLARPGSGAILVAPGPAIGFLSPENDAFSPVYAGNWSLNAQYTAAAVGQDGQLHIAYSGGRAWLETGVFTDYDIFYRRLVPDYQPATTDNLGLQLGVTPNPGNGSGYERFDNMAIPLNKGMAFSDAMSIELLFKPESGNTGRILTQLCPTSWNTWNPASFQLWTDGYDPELLVCGIVTETGPYVLSARIRKNYWNHIAITYADNGEGGNFRLYINGRLSAQATATGVLKMDIANWYLGATNDVEYYAFTGKVDELRFWDIALSQDDIQARKFTALSGSEPGLLAYYTFDEISETGQVADRSGNGNMAYLMYAESAVDEPVSDLQVKFSYTQQAAAFFFSPQALESEFFEWDFGDGDTSHQAGPAHIYDAPGDYEVCLSVFAGSNYDTYCETVSVEGIDRIHPTFGGNNGGITLYIYGGGFTENSTAVLRRAGEADIPAVKNIRTEGCLTAVFALEEEAPGQWDVIVLTGGGQQALPSAFAMQAAQAPQPWVSYNGGGAILKGRWTPQTLTIGNRSNVDAYGVMLWVLVPDAPGVHVEFLNLNLEKPQLAIDNGWSDELDAIGEYIVVDSLFDQPSGERLYPLYFPYLPAQSSLNISLRVKTDGLEGFHIRTFVSPPFYQSPLSPYVQACIAFSVAKAMVKAGIGFVPGGNCLLSAFSITSNVVEGDPPTPSAFENLDTRHVGWNIGTALLECGVSVASLPIGGVMNAITSAIDGAQETEDCKKGFWPSPFSIFQILYYPVSSFDPNEKYGPQGFGGLNFIGDYGRLSYKVSFENKADATAPAQEVFITDTLDITMFNTEEFSFGPVSFGDTILYPAPGFADFARDVDLRPEKNLIVRIQASLDKTQGILQWHFASLDPTTMALTADPFGGFLPPNLNSPEGEGFVTYSIGLKAGIQHGESVRNKASIVFDVNEPILTNEYLNTFDLLPPESELSLQSTAVDSVFNIQITGSDPGAGIRNFEVMVSANGGDYYTWQRTSDNNLSFSGTPGTHYKLYVLAIDSVGNREVFSGVPDAEVDIASGATSRGPAGLQIYPNPASGALYVQFGQANSGRLLMSVYDQLGRPVKTFSFTGAASSAGFALDIKDLKAGVYSLLIETERGAWAWKFVKQ